MMAGRVPLVRPVALVALVVVVVAVAGGCTGTPDPPPPPSNSASNSLANLPHWEPPIPGVPAADVLRQAREAIPDGTDFVIEENKSGFRPYTETMIGYGDQDGRNVDTSTPQVHVIWEQDGTVIAVHCRDLTSAGLSAVMAVCTDLPVTGVPDGALRTVWQDRTGTSDQPQPLPQITVTDLDYEAFHPLTGPARSFSVYGPPQPAATSTDGL